MNKDIQLSIIIVNYKNQHLIIQCVQSIVNFEKQLNYEIIVVDNNSGDRSREELTALFPAIKWVQMPINAGFAKANNAGLSVATGAYVLFLNPDTLFIEPILEKCISRMERDTKVGILGCRLLNEDRTLQLSYHDGDKLFRKILWRNPIVVKNFSGSKHAKRSMEKIRLKHNEEHYAPWLTGAFLLGRRDCLISNVLLWDESFFMYWEDVEFCKRVLSKGLRNLYYPAVSIVHIGGGGADVPIERFKMIEASKELYLRKTKGEFLWKVYSVLFIVGLKIELYLLKRRGFIIPERSVLKKELEFYHVK